VILVAGAAGGDIGRVRSRLDAHHALRTVEYGSDRPAPIAVASDKGGTLGVANDGERVCVLRGFLHLPLPGWEGAHPVDSPDRAAAYLLERYRTHGDAFLDNVWGRFSVFVADATDKSLHIGIDPYGSADVFVAPRGETCYFATNLQSLVRVLGSEVELDRSLEDFFLCHGIYPWRRTPFTNVTGLPAATLFTWKGGLSSKRTVEASKPWGSEFTLAPDADEAAVVTAVHDTFMRGLEDQVGSADHVAVLLGGFDSALVAAGLREMGKEVDTYSYVYPDSAAQYNQPHTDTVSKALGTRHHWVRIEPSDIADGLVHYADVFNSPTNWPNYVIQTERCAQQIREDGFEYCYSGDGCDYLFYGYPLTYKRSRVLSAINIPPKVGNVVVRALERPTLERVVGRPYQVGMGVLRAWQRPYPARGVLGFKIFDESSLRQLRGNDSVPQEHSIDEILTDLAEPFRGLEPARLAYSGKQLLSPNRTKLVGCTDSTGLLITAPFLHRGMADLARSIPEYLLRPDDKRKTSIGKYVLAKMAEDYKLLPAEVIHQRKLGAADGPLVEWYAGPLRSTLLDLVKGLPFQPDARYIDSLLRPKATEKLFARAISGDTSNVVTISHGISLLATYAAYSSLIGDPSAA